MKVIEPTKREVFDEMKACGCTWCGGHGCECHMKVNMSGCFNDTKKRLTRTEYTEDEIREQVQENEKAIKEYMEAIKEYMEF